MKKLLAQKQTFEKFKSYELGHIKIQLINGTNAMVTTVHENIWDNKG